MPNIIIRPARGGGDPIIEFTGSAGGESKIQIESDGTILFDAKTKFPNGISGSLQALSGGEPYLLAGTGITISTGSSPAGQITIASTVTQVVPASPDTGIQFNNAGAFGASANFTFANNKVFLTGSLENGNLSKTVGQNSHAEGESTQTGAQNYEGVWSGGDYAHAEGRLVKAFGYASHAEGHISQTGASGSTGWVGGAYAHAEGYSTVAFGGSSHTEGLSTQTGAQNFSDVWSGGQFAHAKGGWTIAFGEYSHAEGEFSKTGAQNYEGVWSGGQSSHAEGYYTIAFGEYSHAEGSSQTGASGSSGWSGGARAHAEGEYTIAFGYSSHAEGISCHTGIMGPGDIWAGGYGAHAEGQSTVAYGNGSHSEGFNTFAMGEYSHASGYSTIASGSGQNVVGKFNKRNNTDSLFIVGNGNGTSNSNRSDIFLVNTGSVLIGSASLAPDTFFYVGTKDTAIASRFDGNLVVSGTLDVKNGSANSVLSVNGSKVGVNTSSPGFALEVVGDFAATTKSFVIDHPSKPGWKLRHGSLEGPENGVYVRGRTNSSEVVLPAYWADLVDASSITVQITPVGSKFDHFVSYIGVDKICVEFDSQNVEYCYLVQAARKDETFEVEFQVD